MLSFHEGMVEGGEQTVHSPGQPFGGRGGGGEEEKGREEVRQAWRGREEEEAEVAGRFWFQFPLGLGQLENFPS